MSRRGENIYKRRDGRYEARFIVGRKENGKARYKSIYARTYSEARRKKYEAMRTFEESRAAEESASGTVLAVSEEWIKDETRNWKESTLCRYKEKLRLYIIPEYGNRDISDITTDEVEAYLTRLQTEGLEGRKPIGSSTVGLVITVFKDMVRYARKKGYKVKFVAEYILSLIHI